MGCTSQVTKVNATHCALYDSDFCVVVSAQVSHGSNFQRCEVLLTQLLSRRHLSIATAAPPASTRAFQSCSGTTPQGQTVTNYCPPTDVGLHSSKRSFVSNLNTRGPYSFSRLPLRNPRSLFSQCAPSISKSSITSRTGFSRFLSTERTWSSSPRHSLTVDQNANEHQAIDQIIQVCAIFEKLLSNHFKVSF